MLRIALAVLVLGAALPAQSQSLEETYANLCVDKSAKQGETCAALRKAMLDKLNAEEGNALPAGAARTPGGAGAAPVVTPSPWGALDRLPGTAWSGPNGEGILRYRWEQPGRVMVEEWMDKTQMRETRFVLAPAGSTAPGQDGDRLTVVTTADGAFLRQVVVGTASARYAFRIEPDAIFFRYEFLSENQWQDFPLGGFVVKRLPDTAVADRRAAEILEFRKRAADPAEIRRRWGVYADLAGHSWTSTVFRGFRRVTTYRWIVPGLQLEEKTAQPDAPDDAPIAIVHTLDPTTATVAYSTGPMSREIEADGSIRTDVNSGDAVIRTRIALAGPDAYDWAFGEIRSGKYKSLQKLRFDREGAGKRGSGGMLGTIIGAGVGVAAAAYFDLDATDAVAAVAKAAASTSEDAQVQAALNAAGDSALAAGSGGGSAATPSGGAAGGAGSYPTRPNLATGACTGFTESNYRQRALEGSGDAQLYTMCGQAFEYYTMYKRAIAQGYSEADANRTYAAHEDSARVANGFLGSHGAN